jgi:hypothetical protein
VFNSLNDDSNETRFCWNAVQNLGLSSTSSLPSVIDLYVVANKFVVGALALRSCVVTIF